MTDQDTTRPATSAASEGETMRLVPDRVLTDAIYWMARGYERVHSMPRVSDTELANKIEGPRPPLVALWVVYARNHLKWRAA